MNKGIFISVEGIDGAGKTTHLKFIEEYLCSKNYKVVISREPGGTELGEKIRDLLLNGSNMHRITELLLMFASRQELLDKVIKPNLENGICVVVDRYIDASLAYQGFGREIGTDKVKRLIDLLEPAIKTDLTFLFDVTLDLAFTRLDKNQSRDRIEREEREFFNKVRDGYHFIAELDSARVKIINTDRDKLLTRAEIADHLDKLLQQVSN